MLIGVTGRKGSGKDTVGKFLVEDHGFRQTAYANPIKEAVKVALSMTDEQVYGPIEVKETVDPRYGITPRYALQTLGTEWGRNLIHLNIWALAMHARIEQEPDQNWVVTDLRFLNEAKLLEENGGIIIKVVRQGVSTGEFENHQSEMEIAEIIPDVVIHNDGTLEDLQASVAHMVSELKDPKKLLEIFSQQRTSTSFRLRE